MNWEKFYINKCTIKMSNKVKDINMKNHTYYLFNDVINIKKFDLNNIKIDEQSYKNIIFYYIGSLVNKMPGVPRVHKCLSAQVPKYPSSARVPKSLSAQVPKCPSDLWVTKCLKCPSAQVTLVVECPSALWVPEYPKRPSVLSARVLKRASSALSARVPKCSSNALRARVP